MIATDFKAPPSDTEFQGKLDSSASASKIRDLVSELFIDLQLLAFADSDGRLAKCKELQAKIGALVNCPAPGAFHLLRESAALAVFLQVICENHEDLSDSHLRTVASSADVLEALSRGLGAAQDNQGTDFSAVVLDSDEESKEEVSGSLVNAGFEVVSFLSPSETVSYLHSSRAELVVLNVPVPVPGGFDISKQIRRLPLHENTPILVSLVSRTASPGAQRLFICELVLKALNLVHKNRFSAAPSVVVPVGDLEKPDAMLVPDWTPSTTATEPPPEISLLTRVSVDSPEEDDTTLYLHQAGAIVAAQPSSATMFGWEHEELVGMNVATLLKAGWQVDVVQYLEAHASGQDDGERSFHVVAQRKDGTDFPAVVVLRRLGSNSAFQWAAGFRTADSYPVVRTPEPAEQGTSNAEGEAIYLEVRDPATKDDRQTTPPSPAEATHPGDLEVASLRELNEELNQKLHEQEHAILESQQRTESLVQQLADRSAELEQARKELSSYADEGRNTGLELRRRVEAAEAAAERAEKLLAEEKLQRARLESELAKQQSERIAAEERGAEAQQQANALEHKLAAINAELEAAKADLEQRFEEQERLQCEWMSRLNAMKSAFSHAESATKQKEGRTHELEAKISDLQRQVADLSSKLEQAEEHAARSREQLAELESNLSSARATSQDLEQQLQESKLQSESLSSRADVLEQEKEALAETVEQAREGERMAHLRVRDLERQVREGVSSLARATRELESERGERQRAEERSGAAVAQLQELHVELEQQLQAEQAAQSHIADLEKTLQAREQAVKNAEAEAQTEKAAREISEEQLRQMGDLSARFQEHLATFQNDESKLKQTQEEMAGKLRSTEKSLAEAEARLQRDEQERRHLEERIAARELKIEELSSKHESERSELESRLQKLEGERKRMESELLRAQQQSINTSTQNAMVLNSLRRQLRQPIEDLRTSVNWLMEADLADEQKQVAETILESALYLQTALQNGGAATAKA